MPEEPVPEPPSRHAESQPLGPGMATPATPSRKGRKWTDEDRKRMAIFYSTHPAVMWTGALSLLLMVVCIGLMAWHNFVSRMPFVPLQIGLIACGAVGVLSAAVSRKLCPVEIELHRRRTVRDIQTHLLLIVVNVIPLVMIYWKGGTLG